MKSQLVTKWLVTSWLLECGYEWTSWVRVDLVTSRSGYELTRNLFLNSNLSMMNMIVDKYYEFSCICISFFFQRRTLTNDTINSFEDELAGFGPDIPTNGLYVNVWQLLTWHDTYDAYSTPTVLYYIKY